MSGGPGSQGQGGAFANDSGVDCGALKFRTHLASVDPEVLAKVDVGDTLSIDLRQEPHRAIVALTSDAEVLGAITRRVRELLRCIQQLVAFEAEILEKDGADVWVEVRSA